MSFSNFSLPSPEKKIQGLFRDEKEMCEFLCMMPWVLPAVKARALQAGKRREDWEPARKPRFEKPICRYCAFSNKLSGWCLLRRLGRRCTYDGATNMTITVSARSRPKPAHPILAPFPSRK